MQFIDLNKQYQSLKVEIDSSILNVLSKGNYIMGEEVAILEKELGRYCGVKHCITCANGTDALTLALKAIGTTIADNILVPNFTFFASAEVISGIGAYPVFVDIDPDTFNMSPSSLLHQIANLHKQGKNAKAIITVDLFGQPCDYTEIIKIARDNNILIIEDSAQGFGGSLNGKKNCSFGDISTTSFFPAKPLGCYGDGGAIFTDDDEYATVIKSLRVHGKGSDKYENVRIGFNSRLDTIQAAVLLSKLKAFESYELDRRNECADAYTNRLKDLVKTPVVPNGVVSSWAQYTITLSNEQQRQAVQDALASFDIPSMVYYPRTMVQQPVYASYQYDSKEIAVSNGITKKILALPMHPYLEISDIDKICAIISDCLGQLK